MKLTPISEFVLCKEKDEHWQDSTAMSAQLKLIYVTSRAITHCKYLVGTTGSMRDRRFANCKRRKYILKCNLYFIIISSSFFPFRCLQYALHDSTHHIPPLLFLATTITWNISPNNLFALTTQKMVAVCSAEMSVQITNQNIIIPYNFNNTVKISDLAELEVC